MLAIFPIHQSQLCLHCVQLSYKTVEHASTHLVSPSLKLNTPSCCEVVHTWGCSSSIFPAGTLMLKSLDFGNSRDLVLGSWLFWFCHLCLSDLIQSQMPPLLISFIWHWLLNPSTELQIYRDTSCIFEISAWMLLDISNVTCLNQHRVTTPEKLFFWLQSSWSKCTPYPHTQLKLTVNNARLSVCPPFPTCPSNQQGLLLLFLKYFQSTLFL